MLTKRIIPCLDVKDGRVVKGVQFKNHRDMGDPVELAQYYSDQGADELVFYDITASAEKRSVDINWIQQVASNINIPFCVAGGISDVEQAEKVLASGADKISINSPALINPSLIQELSQAFGRQCVVVGVDSKWLSDDYYVYKFTGKEETSQRAGLKTTDWVKQSCELGAGEIVLNCMNQDGVRNGYDISQLKLIREICPVPLIASGGAGLPEHFVEVFNTCDVDGALAATIFHNQSVKIADLKQILKNANVPTRI
ncbi:MAG: imidazole glycerol phosphate synthase subunit HisF [Bdellovibrionales bacterium]|nr:imidazole glycerol phosphate synthase subunit HisF [Bdellovibrionales bacterium]